MELRRSSHDDGFKSNSERDLESVFQIDVANNQSELMRSLEKFWKACNEIEIRVETLFVFYTQDRIFGALTILCIAGFGKRNE